MTILKRFQERKLVQWTLAYLAGAWLIIEVFSTLQEGLAWPPGPFSVLLSVLGIGLVLTPVLAWYHGEQGRQRVSGPELLIITGLLVVATLLLSVVAGREAPIAEGSSGGSTTPSGQPPNLGSRTSIAVLPFENRSEREEDEYFVGGLHEEVLAQLAKIRSLDSKSRTSVLEYRNSPENIRTIGEELGARYVVEGSVQRAGRTVRMTVRLVEAAADEQRWSQSYDRELTVENVLALQREIALQIASRVGAEVLPFERAQLDVQAPDSLLAYERYLEGLSHQSVIELGRADAAAQAQARTRAIEALEEAIALEPEWAPPRAALGRVYHFMASGGIEPSTNYSKARAAIDAALRLDSLHAPAWASHAFVLHLWEGDFAGAEAAYQRAFALGDPPWWRLGILYRSLGRYDEAVTTYERAADVNPRSAIVQTQYGQVLLCAGEHERAVEVLRTAESMRDDSSGGSVWLAYAYLVTNQTEEATSLIASALRQTASDAWMALLLAMADSTGRAETFLEEAQRVAPTLNDIGPVAEAMAVLGRPDDALDYLNGVVEPGTGYRRDFQCFVELRGLADDPRYQSVLDRLGGER